MSGEPKAAGKWVGDAESAHETGVVEALVRVRSGRR